MKKHNCSRSTRAWAQAKVKRTYSPRLDALDAEELRWMTSELQSSDFCSDEESKDEDDTDFGYLLQFDDRRLVDMIRAA